MKRERECARLREPSIYAHHKTSSRKEPINEKILRKRYLKKGQQITHKIFFVFLTHTSNNPKRKKREKQGEKTTT